MCHFGLVVTVDGPLQTIKRVNVHFAAFRQSLEAVEPNAPGEESSRIERTVLAQVVRNLFVHDPIEYVKFLISRADQELQTSQNETKVHPHSSCAGVPFRASDIQAPTSGIHRTRRTPFDANSLQTAADDISFGAQLAAALFLTNQAPPPASICVEACTEQLSSLYRHPR